MGLGVWDGAGFSISSSLRISSSFSISSSLLVYDGSRVFQTPYLKWYLETRSKDVNSKLSPKFVCSISKIALSEEPSLW